MNKRKPDGAESPWTPILEVRFREGVAEPGKRSSMIMGLAASKDLELHLDADRGLVRAVVGQCVKLYPLSNVREIACS